ncbi:methyltransferase [Halobaculum sp. CBA1158]|uniref:methyltransferase n=1 Tax=Halobaculum sp. CBA1158 TaxID=2904243 RepID=UPI001F44ABD5|nr:methyltransferase [Halobaculum sp. CBA1158]UIP01041.1 methyltransferase [Halobaculum sp. CBA1158]
MTRTPYTLPLESRVSEGPQRYQFHTADGVCSKDAFRTSELQLLESLWEADVGDLLCPEANYGVVGTILSAKGESVQMTESSARATHICEKNIRENDADAEVSLLADLTTVEREFDTVAYAPKPYTALPVGKQRIADSLAVLRTGGSLYVAASKQSGLTRYRDCLQELGATVEQVSKSGDSRLLKATRPKKYNPTSYVSPEVIQATIDGIEPRLVTVPGLFSAAEVDRGTRLLMESVAIEDGEQVLDVCCGYGAIGAYAAHVAECDVWLSDDNKIATTCAECTLEKSDVDGTVVTADCVEGVSHQTFDRVLCNPPTHAGEGVLSELFAGIHGVLDDNGVLCIVHHAELDLSDHLSRFSSVERGCTGEEHVVLEVTP